jgi:hypothetical protein
MHGSHLLHVDSARAGTASPHNLAVLMQTSPPRRNFTTGINQAKWGPGPTLHKPSNYTRQTVSLIIQLQCRANLPSLA